jgi:hypothetical protein
VTEKKKEAPRTSFMSADGCGENLSSKILQRPMSLIDFLVGKIIVFVRRGIESPRQAFQI